MEFRNFSVRDVVRCLEDLALVVVAGNKAEVEALGRMELCREVNTVAWMLSTPKEAVRAAFASAGMAGVGAREAIEGEVDLFEEGIDLEGDEYLALMDAVMPKIQKVKEDWLEIFMLRDQVAGAGAPSEEERAKLLAAAFEEKGTDKIQAGGIVLRNFTYRSFVRAGEVLRLTLVVGSDKEIMELPLGRFVREAMMVAWMQSAEPEAVRAAFLSSGEGAEAVELAVDLFEEEVEFDAGVVLGLFAQVTRWVKMARAAWFSMEKRETKLAAGDPPPNS